MIIEQEVFQDTVVGADKEMTFSIDTESSGIFEILRDKMYKNKIGAIAREITSNSRDANRENNIEEPVEIEILNTGKLTSEGDASISFKDYGKGIPPNKMADIYLKYGASDKRSSNKLTGGFGLGAKTPFAYNDTFTVITIADYQGERKKYTYTAMLDVSGKGKMVLFDERETTERTGTTVIVPIKNSVDGYEFEKEVKYYTKTWGEGVKYINFIHRFASEKLEVLIEEDDLAIYIRDSYSWNNVELLIDNIPYPLDRNVPEYYKFMNLNTSILTVLKFDTGDLTISANRESVQYDNKTIERINNKVEEVYQRLEKRYSTYIEDQPTFTEACEKAYCLSRKRNGHSINYPDAITELAVEFLNKHEVKVNPTWNGIKTDFKTVFTYHTVTHVTIKEGKNKYTASRNFTIDGKSNKLPVYYGDAHKNARRNENVWKEGHSEFYIIRPYKTDCKKSIEEFMNFVFKYDIDFNLYSELEMIKSNPKEPSLYTYQKKEYVTLKARKVNKNWGSIDPVEVQVDRDTFETSIESDNVVYEVVESIADAERKDSTKLNLLATRGYTAYYFRKRDVENWLIHTDLQHKDKVYDKEVKELKKEVKRGDSKIINHLISHKIKEILTMPYAGYAEESSYKDIILKLLPKKYRNFKHDSSISYGELYLVKDLLKDEVKTIDRELRSIFDDKYPLLKHIVSIPSYKSTSPEVKEIEKYIKQVNKYYASKRTDK